MVGLLMVSSVWAGSITGHIYGVDDQPVSNAQVYAINPGLQAAQTSTNDQGEYRLDRIPAGHYRLWVIPAEGDPHVARYFPDGPRYCDGTLFPVDDDGTTIDLTLPIGASLAGHLMDTNGNPISNARIRAESQSEVTPRSCFTDAAGRFLLNGLEEGEAWRIQATKSGLPSQWWGNTYDRTEATEVDPIESPILDAWTTLGGIQVSGTVAGPSGPVEDATVRVYSARQLVQTTTDSRGQYQARGLPPGEVTAWAEAPGLATTYLRDADRPDERIEVSDENSVVEDVNIEMPTQATFAMVIEGDAPRTNGDLSGVTAVLYNDAHTVARAAISNEDGLIEWNALHGGQYEALVYGGDVGHPDDWVRDNAGDIQTYTVEAEQDNAAVMVRLPRAVTLTGRVVDEQGNPISSASVIVTPSHDSDTGIDTSSEPFFIESTNAHGQFSIVGIPEGLWDIRSQASPNCETDPGYVTSYWPSQEDPMMSSPLHIDLDTPVEQLLFVLANDNDHDQMGDTWERRYKLNTALDDADEDPDKDGLSNLVEFRLRTNPLEPEGYWVVTRGCGCATGRLTQTLSCLPLILICLLRRRAGAEPRTLAHLGGRTSTDNW